MRTKLFVPVFVLIIASLVLAACAAPATPTAAAPQPAPATEMPAAPAATEVPQPTPLPAGSVQITGAGATFPLPVYSQWNYAYQYVDPAVVMNYNGVGSGAGKTAIIKNTVDYAGSDSTLSDQNYTDGKDLQMYPMLAGAVDVIYNLKTAKAIPTPAAGATPVTLPALVLDRQTLVDIYNAKVTMWNDPKIVALNPGLVDYLPASKITVAHRSDGSGTTEIFTKSLTSFSPDWTAGGASSVEWPVDKAGNGVGGKGNAGVAAAVLNTPNSIGYVEDSYAKSNGLSIAQMINQAGKTVKPSADSVNAAMTEFAGNFTDKFTNTIVDGKNPDVWPMAGYTYIILHTESMTDCVKAQKLLQYLEWAQTDAGAQQAAAKLGYSVLPADVRDQVIKKLGEVTCNGQPVLQP
jgi:phosphate transport system substrate-binding protein